MLIDSTPIRAETSPGYTQWTQEEFDRAHAVSGGRPWHITPALVIERFCAGQVTDKMGLELGACWRSGDLRNNLKERGAKISTTGFEDPYGSQDILDFLKARPNHFDFIFAPGVLSQESENPKEYAPNTPLKLIHIYEELYRCLLPGGILIVIDLKHELDKGLAPQTQAIVELGYGVERFKNDTMAMFYSRFLTRLFYKSLDFNHNKQEHRNDNSAKLILPPAP